MAFNFVTMQAYDEAIRDKILEAVKIYWLDIYANALPMQARRKLQAYRDKASHVLTPAEKEYNAYMKSLRWADRATKRKRDFKDLCGICSVSETADQAHHVHHLDYDRFMNERPGDLLPLCIMCHCFIHPLGTMADEVFRQNADNQSIANSLDHLRIYRHIDGIDDLVAVYLYIAASSKSKPVDRVATSVKLFLMELAAEYSIDVLKRQLLYTWHTRGEIKKSLRQYLTYACRNDFGHEINIEQLKGLIHEAREES